MMNSQKFDASKHFKIAIIAGSLISIAIPLTIIVMKYFYQITDLQPKIIVLIPLSLYAFILVFLLQTEHLTGAASFILFGILFFTLYIDAFIWIWIFYGFSAFRTPQLPGSLIIPAACYIIPAIVMLLKNKNHHDQTHE